MATAIACQSAVQLSPIIPSIEDEKALIVSVVNPIFNKIEPLTQLVIDYYFSLGHIEYRKHLPQEIIMLLKPFLGPLSGWLSPEEKQLSISDRSRFDLIANKIHFMKVSYKERKDDVRIIVGISIVVQGHSEFFSYGAIYEFTNQRCLNKYINEQENIKAFGRDLQRFQNPRGFLNYGRTTSPFPNCCIVS